MSGEGLLPWLRWPVIGFHWIGYVKIKSLQLEYILVGVLYSAVARLTGYHECVKAGRGALVILVDDVFAVGKHTSSIVART